VIALRRPKEEAQLAQSWRESVLIRYSGRRHHFPVVSLRQKMEAEVKMRELLDDQGLPPPDEVEYGFACVRLLWRETRTVVVIDIDEPPAA
jgi:hypothetical protein